MCHACLCTCHCLFCAEVFSKDCKHLVIGLYVKLLKQKLLKWFSSLLSEKSESYKAIKLKASTFLPFLISSVVKHSPF